MNNFKSKTQEARAATEIQDGARNVNLTFLAKMDECSLEYRIYIQNTLHTDPEGTEDEYRSVLTEYLAYLSPFIGDYIWQSQSFTLSHVPKKGNILHVLLLLIIINNIRNKNQK
jgi:hypothetical protein